MKSIHGSKSFQLIVSRFFIVLLLVVSSNSLLLAESLQVSVNNTPYTTFTAQELEQLAYPIPSDAMFTYIQSKEQGSALRKIQRGITLDELFPVMVEAWELQITRPDGTAYTLKSPELAEELPFYVLLLESHEDANASFALNIVGEVSQDRSMEIWIGWEGVSQLKQEILRFANLHGVSIKSLEVPKISSKLVQTQQAGGNIPDVVMVQSDYIYELMQMDAIQPIDYIAHQHYNPQGVHSFNLFNRQWAIPFYYDSQVLICNSSVMEQAGIIPENIKTLADLERAGEAIRKIQSQGDIASKNFTPIVPLSWNLYSAYWLLPFQYGFGKEYLVEKDGGVIVDDPPTKAALTYLLSLIDRGILSANERDAMLANFVSGRTGMIFSASYMIPELERLDFPFQIVPLPVHEVTGRQIAPILDYKGFAITKRSKNPILARRLIQYLGGVGVQQRFPQVMSKLPAWDTAMADNASTDLKQHIVKTGSKGGYEIPPDFAYGIYKNTMWNMIRLILDRKLSVDEGLLEAQRIIDIQVSDQLERLPKGITYENTVGGRGNETKEIKPLGTNTQPSNDDNAGRGFINWLRKLW
jgi:ABC-type glycerol-3-phosphate transport system substrate-binding protein